MDDIAQQIAGSTHGGQAQVGSMGLGEAPDVDHLARDPLTKADRCSGGDGTGRVVLDDRHTGLGEDWCQVLGALLSHRGACRVLRSRLQEHGRGGAAQCGGQWLWEQSDAVDGHSDHLNTDGLKQVQ